MGTAGFDIAHAARDGQGRTGVNGAPAVGLPQHDARMVCSIGFMVKRYMCDVEQQGDVRCGLNRAFFCVRC